MFNFLKKRPVVEIQPPNVALDREHQEKIQKLEQVNREIALAEQKLKQTKEELNINMGHLALEEVGLEYTPQDTSLSDIDKKIIMAKNELALLMANDNVVKTTRTYKIDGSAAQGSKFQKAYCDSLLFGFNAYFNRKLKTVTTQSVYRSIELLESNYDKCNKKAALLGVYLSPAYLHVCTKMLRLEADKKLAKTEERHKLREEKRKLREQEQLIIEAERERKKLEDERKNLQKLFAKAVTEQEQKEIQNKLAKVDKRVEEVDYRVSHYSAGWLYITTTPAMPGVYKAGCTKQLNPLNRLAQLSSASVPFSFECRGLVFSEDVFALEAKLHNRLDSKRVNKENKLKEFFFGEPEEAINILVNEFNEKVKFIDEKWVEDKEDNDID